MLIMHTDNTNDVAVLAFIPSPIHIQLIIANEETPNAKPKNLPGHSKPSK